MTTDSQLSIFSNISHDGLNFCCKVYELFEEIRNSEGGKERLRMRTSNLEKRLIEELLPICKYVQTNYRAGRYISVKWINGSQQFDAELNQSGYYIDKNYFPSTSYIEVTCIMHPNEYLSRELINTDGYAFGLDGLKREKDRKITSIPVSHSNFDFIDTYCQLVIDGIFKKSEIQYPADTSLVVQCFLNTLYTPDEWRKLCDEVRGKLPNHNFREIFIYDSVCEYSATL
ncbi:MAG: hypothetical protein ACAH10_01325 [Methylophilaceae bacterium]